MTVRAEARSIVDWVRHHAGAGRGPALLALDREAASFDQVATNIERTGAALALFGLHRGSRIALCLPEGPEMAGAFLALTSHAIVLPLNPASVIEEVRAMLEGARIDALVVAEGFGAAACEAARVLRLKVLELRAPAAAPAGSFSFVGGPPGGRARANPSPDDIALLLYTSGTTARPKLVPLTHRMLLASAENIARHLALDPTDRCLNPMPLFHSHGIFGGLLASIVAGGSVVCAPRFAVTSFLDAVARFDPTWYTAAPTIHQAFLAAGAEYRRIAPAHRFRFVRSASSSLPRRTIDALHELTGAPIIESYGMTESATQMASNPLPPGVTKAGSVGKPAGAELAIMDEGGRPVAPFVEGEIVARGPALFQGYEGDPAANAEAFFGDWFRTGDLGRFDESGYLWIVGRRKEIINRGGEKIAPREVEEILLEHPDVVEAAVYPAPHETLGEDVRAVVVLRPGSDVSGAALRVRLFARLAEFKVPSRVTVVDAIPRGETAKVERLKLHQLLGSLAPQAYEAPRVGYETVVAEAFAEALGRAEAFGRHDHFLESGGDSLSALRAISRINTRLAIDLGQSAVFLEPTVLGLAALAQAAHASDGIDSKQIEDEIDALSDDEVARLLAAESAAEGASTQPAPSEDARRDGR